jgi:glycosyltransferase involved in cell wall biosynthesis
MARVSVIIPTYNHAEYLPEALDSVLNQTYEDYEIIVVDDGSTDNTKDIMKPYLHEIHYIHQENSGPSKARNNGIRISSGQYIAFLDADDRWTPDKLEIQVQLFDLSPEVGLVFADAEVLEASQTEGISFFEMVGFRKTQTTDSGEVSGAFEKLLEKNFIQTGTVIARRECFERVGFFDESLKLAEDKDMWLRIAGLYKIQAVPKVLLKKRGFSTSDYVSLKQHVLKVLDKMEVLYPETTSLCLSTINRTRARIYGDLAAYYWHQDKIQLARQECLTSLGYTKNLRALRLLVKTAAGKTGKNAVRWLKRTTT